MSITRLPIISSLDPDYYSNGIITSGPSTKNVLFSKYSDERVYATQRPAIKVTSDPEDAGETRVLGRGITFWDLESDYYFVRSNEVYKSDYTNLIGTITGAGRNKIYFAQVSNYLVIIDPEENKGYYILNSAPETVVPITDDEFPGNISGEQLVGGAVSIDGFLFVMTESGLIYNCELNRPDNWDGLGFIGADIDGDNGVAILKHHNHICAIGTDSIEFFFNAGNPVGSPLQRRQDVFHLTGSMDYNTVTQVGDDAFFLGRSKSGTIGLHHLSKFQLSRVSTDTIDRYIGDTSIGQSLTGVNMKFWLSSAWFGEHLLCFMTSVQDNVDGQTNFFPIQTNVYDRSSNMWSTYESILETISPSGNTPNFGIAATSSPDGVASNKGSIILLTGNIINIDLSGGVSDYTGNTDPYVVGPTGEEDYFISGYMVPAPDNPITNNIELEIIMPEVDLNMITYKNGHKMSIIGNTLQPAENNTPLEISWSDDRYKTFSTPRELDTGFRRSLTRLGNFKRRAFKLRYDGADLLRLEALELDVRASRYA